MKLRELVELLDELKELQRLEIEYGRSGPYEYVKNTRIDIEELLEKEI
jgi:hypothetical protein